MDEVFTLAKSEANKTLRKVYFRIGDTIEKAFVDLREIVKNHRKERSEDRVENERATNKSFENIFYNALKSEEPTEKKLSSFTMQLFSALSKKYQSEHT